MRDNQFRGGRKSGVRVNDEIRIKECRLLEEDGSQVGIVSMVEARERAEEVGLDLVEVSPKADPPVVKMIDYGKYKYNLQKKANEAKKKQVTVQVKEIQFRPNIEQHDLDTKLKRIEKFITQGDKVKLVMQFRGREMAYRDAGLEKFKRIIETAEEMGSVRESEPRFMGNRIITIIAPVKKTTSAKKSAPKDASKEGPGAEKSV